MALHGSGINMRACMCRAEPNQAGILSLIAHFENWLENMLISIHTIIIVMIMQLIELPFRGWFIYSLMRHAKYV